MLVKQIRSEAITPQVSGAEEGRVSRDRGVIFELDFFELTKQK